MFFNLRSGSLSVTCLRFVYSEPVSGMRSRKGFLQAATDLILNPDTDAHAVSRTKALMFWFSDNLEVPGKFSKSSSKGWDRRDTKGLSWFKGTAKVHISKAFEMKADLEENGFLIEIIKEN